MREDARAAQAATAVKAADAAQAATAIEAGEAASPLAVIVTFVLAAVGVTALAFFLFVDTTTPLLEIQEVETPDGPAFEVTRTQGGLEWRELEVRFLDRAGTDHAGRSLVLPTGGVDRGDRIAVAQHPPGGEYLMLVTFDGQELVRLRTTL